MVSPHSGLVYFITNKASGTRIDLNNGSSTDGTKIQGWVGANTGNQKWLIMVQSSKIPGEKYCAIMNMASGTLMGLNKGSRRNGTSIQGWAPSPSPDPYGEQIWEIHDSQLWEIVEQGGDVFALRNKSSQTYADLNNGSNANGTSIQGWEAADVDAQRWTFELIDEYLDIKEDSYNILSYSNKIEKCNMMVERAKNDPNWKHSYGVGFNMSVFGFFDPIDAHAALSTSIDHLLNPIKIGTDGQYRIGRIGFDFYHLNMGSVQNLIRSNPGCGRL